MIICRYEITSPPDGQWGTETPNGSWTGLVGQLQQRVNIAVNIYLCNLNLNETFFFIKNVLHVPKLFLII